MPSIMGARNFARQQQKSGKELLISDLNKPINCLRYGSKEDYVNFVLRQMPNATRKVAESFVNTHAIKYKS